MADQGFIMPDAFDLFEDEGTDQSVPTAAPTTLAAGAGANNATGTTGATANTAASTTSTTGRAAARTSSASNGGSQKRKRSGAKSSKTEEPEGKMIRARPEDISHMSKAEKATHNRRLREIRDLRQRIEENFYSMEYRQDDLDHADIKKKDRATEVRQWTTRGETVMQDVSKPYIDLINLQVNNAKTEAQQKKMIEAYLLARINHGRMHYDWIYYDVAVAMGKDVEPPVDAEVEYLRDEVSELAEVRKTVKLQKGVIEIREWEIENLTENNIITKNIDTLAEVVQPYELKNVTDVKDESAEDTKNAEPKEYCSIMTQTIESDTWLEDYYAARVHAKNAEEKAKEEAKTKLEAEREERRKQRELEDREREERQKQRELEDAEYERKMAELDKKK